MKYITVIVDETGRDFTTVAHGTYHACLAYKRRTIAAHPELEDRAFVILDHPNAIQMFKTRLAREATNE